jgi:hypothetical protein
VIEWYEIPDYLELLCTCGYIPTVDILVVYIEHVQFAMSEVSFQKCINHICKYGKISGQTVNKLKYWYNNSSVKSAVPVTEDFKSKCSDLEKLLDEKSKALEKLEGEYNEMKYMYDSLNEQFKVTMEDKENDIRMLKECKFNEKLIKFNERLNIGLIENYNHCTKLKDQNHFLHVRLRQEEETCDRYIDLYNAECEKNRRERAYIKKLQQKYNELHKFHNKEMGKSVMKIEELKSDIAYYDGKESVYEKSHENLLKLIDTHDAVVSEMKSKSDIYKNMLIGMVEKHKNKIAKLTEESNTLVSALDRNQRIYDANFEMLNKEIKELKKANDKMTGENDLVNSELDAKNAKYRELIYKLIE